MSVTIRLATENDAKQIAAIYAPIVNKTTISFEIEAPSVSEMARRIRETTADYPWLVCEQAAQVLGYAYASRHRERGAYQWSVDVSVYVHPEKRRQGVGRGLYTSLFSALALQGLYNAYSGITLPNPASVNLHESMGFQPVGIYRGVGYKLGTWHDVGWWHLTLRPRAPSPLPPKAFRTVRTSPAWDGALAAGVPLLKI